MRTWWAGSHEVVGRGYIHTENSQMASIEAIFTSAYHTKQLIHSQHQPVVWWITASCLLVKERWSHFKNTQHCGHPTSLWNKLQQKQPGQLLAPIPGWIYSYSVYTAIVWWWKVYLAVVYVEASFSQIWSQMFSIEKCHRMYYINLLLCNGASLMLKL